MRILLAEDNVMLADSLSQALGQAGFTIDCMHDGRSADSLLCTQDYALLILDLGLPGLDGLEVLRRLRQRRNPLPVLILYWTAATDADGRVTFRPDVYGRDPAVIRALDAEWQPPKHPLLRGAVGE